MEVAVIIIALIALPVGAIGAGIYVGAMDEIRKKEIKGEL